jgi:aldose 1-epimerase
MFQIIEEQQNDLNRLKIFNEKSGEFVSIIPKFGVNINELVLEKGSALISVLDGNSKLADFSNGGIYNSAKMLPFPNRIKDGRYAIGGKNYQLVKNFPHEQNAIHGLICDKPFEVLNKNINGKFGEIIFSFQYDELHEGFPFKFETRISCKLVDSEGFVCSTQVINNGDHSMPFGEGWHPYFTFNKKVDEIYLKFLSKHLVEVDERLIPTGKVKEYNLFHKLRQIKDTKFDSCFLLQDGKKIHKSEIFDPEKDITITLWQETGLHAYNFLQVYIPPSRMSIALEPMTCNVNAFNNQDGLIILDPGESYSAKYGVSISP